MEGTLNLLYSVAKNVLWPQFVGGTPRKYAFQQTNPTRERMIYLVRLVEEGKLKVVIDQVYQMNDGLQVRAVTSMHCSVSLRPLRRMSVYSARERKAKSS
jgi:hypothetical protein